MVISVILALHGEAFESARISGNYYCFALLKWTICVFFLKNRQEDAGLAKVVPHLISRLIKKYKKYNCFWIGYILKIEGKLLSSHCLTSLCCIYCLEIHNAQCPKRPAQMRLNSSALPRRFAQFPPQHTDLHKTLDTSPTARCRTLWEKPLTSPIS